MKHIAGPFVALLLAAAAPAPARAHIGDDVAQLRQAYGATGKRAGNTMIYQSNGYSICVYFDDNHSAMEVFTRDGSVQAKTDITTDDVKAILALESDGQEWTEVASRSGKPTWLRADHKLIARLSQAESSDDKVFMVMLNAK